jgi:hypothetical protein
VGTHVAGVLVTLFACVRAALEGVGDSLQDASVELARTSASFMHAAGVSALDTALVVAAACLDFAADAHASAQRVADVMGDASEEAEGRKRLGVRLAVARLTESVVVPGLGRAEQGAVSSAVAAGVGPQQPLAVLHCLLRYFVCWCTGVFCKGGRVGQVGAGYTL